VAIIETTKKLISQQAKAQKLTDTEKIRSLLSDLSKHSDKYDGEPFTITEKKNVIDAKTKKVETIETTRESTILHEMAALLRAVATHIDPTNENAEKLKQECRELKSEYAEKMKKYEAEYIAKQERDREEFRKRMSDKFEKVKAGDLSGSESD
jgi:hypothetical protein